MSEECYTHVTNVLRMQYQMHKNINVLQKLNQLHMTTYDDSIITYIHRVANNACVNNRSQ